MRHFIQLNDEYFACTSFCEENSLIRNKNTTRLHIIKNDLKHSYKTISDLFPDRLLMKNGYIYIVDDKMQKIETFQFQGKKLHEEYLIPDLTSHYLQISFLGQFVMCDLFGNIHIQDSEVSKKLQSEIKQVLLHKNIPSDVIPIVHGYLGFFKTTIAEPRERKQQDISSLRNHF